jgi:hypothetical protein
MPKRLIEVALPLKEVSEQSAREKSIRHGHISTLHIWWARRPLAACRTAVFASLIPDPDDPECPEVFRNVVREVLGRSEFRPRSEEDGRPVEDTPRNRCLEFIKHLVRWENSNNPEYIEPARRLIAAAHKILHPGAEGDAPKVLDPFAGGGAIPLEALRLGCEAHAIDLNPVAHLIELCTLVYPQKYGQPDSRPVPDYINRTVGRSTTKKRGKGAPTLFDGANAVSTAEDEIIPDIEITVVWKWSYGGEKVPADEAFKLAQALGMDTSVMWDRTDVLEKSGENVAAVSVEKRKKIKDLGEPNPTGTPASLIDVLHRLCAFREKGDTTGMAEFLARSGQGLNPALWLVAQAVSEILPDGDKEKQLMQGLLNQKDQLDQAEAKGRLF